MWVPILDCCKLRGQRRLLYPARRQAAQFFSGADTADRAAALPPWSECNSRCNGIGRVPPHGNDFASEPQFSGPPVHVSDPSEGRTRGLAPNWPTPSLTVWRGFLGLKIPQYASTQVPNYTASLS